MPIRTEAEYKSALVEIEQFFDVEPVPGAPEAIRFEVLADRIEAYEAIHHPIDPPEPDDTGPGTV